jgi:hypothetical protein
MDIEIDFIGEKGLGFLDLFELSEPDDQDTKLQKEDFEEPV